MALPAINIEIRADEKQAVAALKKVDGALEQVSAQATSTGAASAALSGRLANLGNVSGQTRARIQNTAFQFQDLAVQISAGTKVSTALAQQLPQLAGGFGAVGAVVGVLAAVGIPILAYAFGETEKKGDALTEALKNIKEAAAEADIATRAFLLGLASGDEVVVQDKIIANLREITRLEKDLTSTIRQRKVDARRRIGELQEETAELQKHLDHAVRAREQQERMTRFVYETTEAERLLGQQMVDVAAKAALAANETERMANAAMAAANEWVKMQGIRSRFAGEDLLMGQAVVTPGLGTPAGKKIGGGGGGGGGGADPNDGRLGALIESLQTERETLQVWYSESLLLLQTANEQELIALGGHNEARLRLEQEYQERLRDIRSGYSGDALSQAATFFGDLAGAMQSGNEKMLRIARVFGAAQALINSYRAFTDVLADPSLPWFAKIPAAIGVMSAGLGMVSAIKGVNAGGGGGGAGAAAGAASVPNVSRNVAISLTGEIFDRRAVQGLINQINEAVEDGARIRLV